jgi:predicted RecA/RadA family phage recombinase
VKNFIQAGDTLTLTAPSGGVVSGGGYIIGDLFVVSTVTAAQGLPFAGKTTGVFEFAKLSAQAWTEGAKVYWDATNSRFTTVATGNRLVGTAAEAAANPSSVGRVRLDGNALPVAG